MASIPRAELPRRLLVIGQPDVFDVLAVRVTHARVLGVAPSGVENPETID
jgi:hypothetical protein